MSLLFPKWGRCSTLFIKYFARSRPTHGHRILGRFGAWVPSSCEFRCHRAGSQVKMFECHTKAGNQECFAKLEKLTLSRPFTLDMLNNFCFHVYAQKSLFIAENCNAF